MGTVAQQYKATELNKVANKNYRSTLADFPVKTRQHVLILHSWEKLGKLALRLLKWGLRRDSL
jgi:hypothetical protein